MYNLRRIYWIYINTLHIFVHKKEECIGSLFFLMCLVIRITLCQDLGVASCVLFEVWGRRRCLIGSGPCSRHSIIGMRPIGRLVFLVFVVCLTHKGPLFWASVWQKHKYILDRCHKRHWVIIVSSILAQVFKNCLLCLCGLLFFWVFVFCSLC